MTSREAVNWLINLIADIGKAEHRALWHYEQALSEIKETLERNNWIPCSDGLPEKDGEYLVTDNGWPITTVEVDVLCGGTWVSNDNVVAWMPLPEPWEGEQE